jgi:hypothetical protein
LYVVPSSVAGLDGTETVFELVACIVIPSTVTFEDNVRKPLNCVSEKFQLFEAV